MRCRRRQDELHQRRSRKRATQCHLQPDLGLAHLQHLPFALTVADKPQPDHASRTHLQHPQQMQGPGAADQCLTVPDLPGFEQQKIHIPTSNGERQARTCSGCHRAALAAHKIFPDLP